MLFVAAWVLGDVRVSDGGLIEMQKTADMVIANISGLRSSGLRALPDTQFNFFDYLFKAYGCWCTFGTDSNSAKYGRGLPVDAWDKMCQDLERGYRTLYKFPTNF